jgi:c-di-GMP-binding flagellar brake protein YcgR
VAVSAPSLPAGEHVGVVLPHVGTLPATVESADGGIIAVALAVPDNRVQRLEGREVSIESASARGIQRYTGTLKLGARPELLQVVVAGEAERIQRREWARIEAIVPVHVKPLNEPGGGQTTSLNVSGGGVLINDPWNLPMGTDVRVELVTEGPDGPRIHALGRVVRSPQPDQKGIRFDDLARDDEERLIKFVRERERMALRMARGR